MTKQIESPRPELTAVGNSDLGCISEAEQKELLMGWMGMVQERRNQGRLTDI